MRNARVSSFDFIQVRIASPQEIRGPKDPGERARLELQGLRNWWSWGEVTQPETINYRSFKPEKDGLFCERIFGPVRDWECHCGKYNQIRYRGVICDHCGVEVTLSNVRRERMGHIELAVPVANTLFIHTRGVIAALLDMTRKDVERVVYYSNYVVIEPGKQDVRATQVLDEDECFGLRAKAKEEDDGTFAADTGAAALRDLLQRLDLNSLAGELRADIARQRAQAPRRKIAKRLEIVDAFRNSGDSGDAPNRPEWMILDVLPVMPPNLRPIVPLDRGRLATSDLNILYRSVISRNNRLQSLIVKRAPEVILRIGKRMLQEAVDALFDNSRRFKATRGRGKLPLKSLSDMLKGKHGRFRRNLLGKRVDYSGRSVIVVGPELQLHQCGLPKLMALELFKPFIMHELVERRIAETGKCAKQFVERESPEAYEILEEIIREHPVLLNRAPTLHRLGIQAFEPVLVEGKAIRIHPLVCAAFNADFDGDQIAVHVPLAFEAQLEARLLMLSSNNILKPSDGRPVAKPTQDIVLGCYFATRAPTNFHTVDQQTLRRFTDLAEVVMRLALKRMNRHTVLQYLVRDLNGERWERTTAGRVLFNAIVPPELGYKNDEMNKEALSELVFESYRKAGLTSTAQFLDRLKTFGFTEATSSGVSIGIEDLMIPPARRELFDQATQHVTLLEKAYDAGRLSHEDLLEYSVREWMSLTEMLDAEVLGTLKQGHGGDSMLWMMLNSGARASLKHIRQLVAMKGLIARPEDGQATHSGTLARPIASSFREGLNVVEYFVSCRGVRKAISDRSLGTADSGYLTRRLVDVAQSVTITEEDCGTIAGIEVRAINDGAKTITPLSARIIGNVAAEDVEHPVRRDDSGRAMLVVEAGQIIDEDGAARIELAGIETVKIRSVLTCEGQHGLCAQCYGRDLARLELVELGEAVGVIAAQSLGEAATQLFLNASLLSGAADLRLARRSMTESIVSTEPGQARWVDLIDGESLGVIRDASTGHAEYRVKRRRGTILDPRVEIWQSGEWRDRRIATYPLPDGAVITAADGMQVHVGAQVARIPGTLVRVNDITAGLPRLLELFEVRVPDRAAVLAEIDGQVQVGRIFERAREVFVTAGALLAGSFVPSPGDHVTSHSVAPGAQVLVQRGDYVRAGDRLSEGSPNLHELLRIVGPQAVQEYLVNELQTIYRSQRVAMNDKHIAVIVRQMLQKVLIVEPGVTGLTEGSHVNRKVFRDANYRARVENLAPAVAEPLLLGITKASLESKSFLSAASFQETMRVLADAVVRGAVDALVGLKENVIVGHLIPAGTGIYRGQEVQIELESPHPGGPAAGTASSSDVLDAMVGGGSHRIQRQYAHSNNARYGERSYPIGTRLSAEATKQSPPARKQNAVSDGTGEVARINTKPEVVATSPVDSCAQLWIPGRLRPTGELEATIVRWALVDGQIHATFEFARLPASTETVELFLFADGPTLLAHVQEDAIGLRPGMLLTFRAAVLPQVISAWILQARSRIDAAGAAT